MVVARANRAARVSGSSWIAVRTYGTAWQERQRPGALEFQRSRPLVTLRPDGLVRTSCGLSADCCRVVNPQRLGLHADLRSAIHTLTGKVTSQTATRLN